MKYLQQKYNPRKHMDQVHELLMLNCSQVIAKENIW